MLKLMKNEWIKIFSKASTYIMLVLVAVFVVGFSWMMFRNSQYEYSSNSPVDAKGEMEYLTLSKPEGYEVEVAMYEFMLDSGREWYYGQWQTSALQEVYQEFKAPLLYQAEDLTEEVKDDWNNRLEKACACILANDWNGYVEERLDYLNATVSDPEMLEAKSYYWNFMKENNLTPEDKDWREESARTIGNLKESLVSLEEQKDSGVIISEDMEKEVRDPLALEEYRLEHGIEFYVDETEFIL